MKAGEEKIMEVAYKLFKQRGVSSTNLQHVARGCNSSLWDINLIVKSKKDLVLAVFRHMVRKKTAQLLINAALSPSAVTELSSFFKFVDDTVTDLGAEIFTELRRYNPLALDQLRELVDHKLIPYLQRNIDRGLKEGFFRNELDSEHYASAYFYILRTVLENERDWVETKNAISHINDIFLHGVLSIKGMRI